MKPILSILAIVLCLGMAASGFANDNFFFDLKKAEGIKLLAGGENIAMLFASNSVLTDNLRENFSDTELKFRLIGLEFAKYKWGTPYLNFNLNLVEMQNIPVLMLRTRK